MASPRGLAASLNRLAMIRGATITAVLILCAAQLAGVLSGRPVELLLAHSLTIILIALAASSWGLGSVTSGLAISLAVLAVTVWVWAAAQEVLLGYDVLALVVVMGVASMRQRVRTRRLTRQEQVLSDVEEAQYLTEQNLRIAQQTHEALQRKLARYQQLQTIAEGLSRLTNLDAIAQLVVTRAFELIGKSSVCLLFLADPQRQELALYASEKAPQVATIRTKQGDQFDRYVLRTQRPLLVHDVSRDFRFSQTHSADRASRSVIACPVRVNQRVEGVLRLDSPEAGIYPQDDLRFLDILLDLVDTAMTNARLFAQTQQLALTDGLTSLYRRQPFLDQLAREVARAGRSREPFTVLMLDLDEFKRYNDQCGHPAGDTVLKTVAELIRLVVPPDGLCARYGGEEFAVLLPKASRERGHQTANCIRELVEGRLRELTSGPNTAVTVSVGVAVFPEDAKADLELIRRADERLYQAKRAGKNQVCSS